MDRRVKYTKRVIKKTLIELLQKKDINKITVSELCSICDINRATFYRYYIDIYDLLEKIEQDVISDLREMLVKYKDYPMKDVIKEYLKVFLENKDLVKIVFSNSKNIYFLNDFIAFIYENCKAMWFKEINAKEEELKTLASVFVFNGILGVINYWVQNNFDEDIETLSDVIEKISYNGLLGYGENNK